MSPEVVAELIQLLLALFLFIPWLLAMVEYVRFNRREKEWMRRYRARDKDAGGGA